MPTQAKVESVEALKERLGAAKSAVLTEYRGLSVRQLSDLRKQLKGAAAEYKVVKNRLARLAVKGSALDALGEHLKGPTGLVFTKQDPVAVAKALQAFVRTNPQLLISSGWWRARLCSRRSSRPWRTFRPRSSSGARSWASCRDRWPSW